jgi:hypothetical protein
MKRRYEKEQQARKVGMTVEEKIDELIFWVKRQSTSEFLSKFLEELYSYIEFEREEKENGKKFDRKKFLLEKMNDIEETKEDAYKTCWS